MATVSTSLADLPLEELALYHVMDPYLSSILIFYGPVATAHAPVSSSRIQAHLFSAAGFKSYPRITVSPAAPLYAAVNHLPREKQGDETCRGLAVSLLKYFTELAEPVRARLRQLAKAGKPSGRIPKMFEETHAADLTNRVTRVDATTEIVRDLRDAYRERAIPWIDLDVVLPPGSIVEPAAPHGQSSTEPDVVIDDDQHGEQYGQYASLIQAFGDPVFLPTARLRRAPSQPTTFSKSKVFTKNQKESLRLAMCEVVDTEERYVSKIYDLVHNVVEEFQQKARSKPASSGSPDESALTDLFPPCLNEILEVNMGFLAVIRQLLEETEQDALADLANDTDLQSSASSRLLAQQGEDPMGAMEFANSLLEWFPRFAEPYADYMRAHTGFTQTLNSFLKDDKSSFSRRVHDTGEQKLRSLLMEPVQRLPRYSLLIDAMTGNIPSIHPSVKLFLKARDIIKDICSLDNPVNTDHSQSLRRVMKLVEYWPPSVAPIGRLISAVDATEVLPPYRSEGQDPSNNGLMALLYKNCLVLLSRIPGSNMTARSLLSELENHAVHGTNRPLSQSSAQFRFVRALDLRGLRCMQSTSGRILYLMPGSDTSSGTTQSTQMTPHAMQLTGMYEDRTNRLIEEIIKAKIEGRFSEQERESGKWTLRNPSIPSSSLGVLAPVFEDDPSGAMQRTCYSNIRLVFDTPKAIRSKILENASVEVVVSVTRIDGDQYRIELDAITGTSTVDTVGIDAFISTLSTRIGNLLPSLYHPQNRSLTETLVYSNIDILRQVAGHIISQTRAPRAFRPPSPTKLISNLWGGGNQTKEPPSLSKPFHPNLVLADIPRMTPSKVTTRPTTSPANLDEAPPKISIVAPPSTKEDDHISALERTFSSYMLAIRSRSGNIVGRTLRSRANADQTMVNELYNVLQEDPSRLQAAAEVPVDVLFVAFEAFMSHSWKDHIGALLSPEALRMVQIKFDSLFPGDFEVFFRKTLGELCPQNRRALGEVIRLVAELLEASGNDGDRGALTAAFAEILTENENPRQYISLLDRLVDDFENLFDQPSSSGTKSFETTPSRPMSSHTGSISSNTSSFRKRFGFGLHRENSSRSDGESKVSSLIRTLSKTKNSGDSESKPSLFRTWSTDTDSRITDLLRPVSRDRPALYGAFLSEENIGRPGSAHDDSSLLHSIDEAATTLQKDPGRKKKRRSSLSDLPPPSTPTRSPNLNPIEISKPLTPATAKSRPQSEVFTNNRQLPPRGSPAPKSPIRPSQTPRSTTQGNSGRRHPSSPTRRPASPLRLGSPLRKENSHPRPTLTERAINKKTEYPPSPTLTRKKRSDTLTSIPQPTKSLPSKDRPVTSHGSEFSTKRDHVLSSPQKPQKLRMQSPQKLRDRLSYEKQAQNSAESAFQAELQLIGEEISALTRSAQTSPPRQRVSTKSASTDKSDSAATLASRVKSLESRFSTFCNDAGSRTAGFEKDLETSLAVSEKRAKKLDELYREASAENEALYERFNTELGKVVKDVRLGNGEEALKSQLRDALDEIGRVKKENLRLKREVGGLRAQRVEASPVKKWE